MSVLDSIIRYKESEDAKVRADIGMIGNAYQAFQQSRNNALLLEMERKKLDVDLATKGLRFGDSGQIVPATDLIESLGLRKISLADIMGGQGFGGRGTTETTTPTDLSYLIDELSVPTTEGVDVKLKRKKTEKEFGEETQREAQKAATIGAEKEKQLNISKITRLGDITNIIEQKFLETNPHPGVLGPILGMLDVWASNLQATKGQQTDKAYRDFIKGMRAQLARGMGEVGNLSEPEQKAAMDLMPSLLDSKETGLKKLENLRGLIRSITNRTGKQQTSLQSFVSEAEAEKANLPKETIIIINGRKARID